MTTNMFNFSSNAIKPATNVTPLVNPFGGNPTSTNLNINTNFSNDNNKSNNWREYIWWDSIGI